VKILNKAGDFDIASKSFFIDKVSLGDLNENEQEIMKKDESKKVFDYVINNIDKLSDDYSNFNDFIDTIVADTELKKGQILRPLRLAITGLGHGPNLNYVIEFYGKDVVCERLKIFIN